jgi:hypothetical protein
MPTVSHDLARDHIGDRRHTLGDRPTMTGERCRVNSAAYPAACTASVALRAAISTGSQTGENGGA